MTDSCPKDTMNDGGAAAVGGNLVVTSSDGRDRGRDEDEQANDHSTTHTQASTTPTAVYSLIWSFLLDSAGSNTSKAGYSIDLKTISSFMLVNRTSLAEFHGCNGWNQCALALKQEATCKRAIVESYQKKGNKITKSGTNVIIPLTRDKLNACHRFLAKANDMRKVDARRVRIQTILLPKTLQLAATTYDGNTVSILFSYTSKLEESIRIVEREINIQPFLRHVVLFLGAALLNQGNIVIIQDDEE